MTGDITLLLSEVRQGGPDAENRLMQVVYDELRRIARGRLAAAAPGATLRPTELVHEAWLRLGADQTFDNRAHYFSAAAEAMRRTLVDRVRRRMAQRRGGGAEHADIDEMEIQTPGSDEELLTVHEALDRLAAEDAGKAELVKLRYFAGMTIEEAAAVCGISVATANRHWAFARAWLAREIQTSLNA